MYKHVYANNEILKSHAPSSYDSHGRLGARRIRGIAALLVSDSPGVAEPMMLASDSREFVGVLSFHLSHPVARLNMARSHIHA